MHHAAKWPPIVDRMVLRMEGRGNMGKLMADMMAGVKAPAPEETLALIAYLQKHAQTPLDPKRYPEVNRRSGEAFRLACSQCHVLPDPQRHTAAEWRAVVARMQENMEWMNRVVGTRPIPGEPQLQDRRDQRLPEEVRALSGLQEQRKNLYARVRASASNLG